MTGAAASPGALADRHHAAAGLAHHPVAAASRTPSTARCRCPTAIRRSARGTTRRFSSRMPPMSCWPTTPNGCAIAWPPTAFPPTRSKRILPCSATRTRWRRRSPGIARAARSAGRSARSACRRSTSGAMPTTPSAAIAAEGTVDFIAAPYRFEVLPGVGHFAADQAPARVSELLLEHVARIRSEDASPTKRDGDSLRRDVVRHRLAIRLSMFQKTGVAGPSSTPVSDFRQALGASVLAERDVDHLIVGFLLDVGGDLLLLLGRRRARERVLQLLDLGVLRPAEPAAVLAACRRSRS